MKIAYIILLLAVFFKCVCALSISDFVPDFLMPGDRAESDVNLPVKPLVEVKRNASSETTWYCTRMQNSGSNVFCNKNREVTKVVTYGNSASGDKAGSIDDSLSSNNDLNQDMAARTTSFQDQKVADLIQRQQQIPNATLPLQPSKDVKMDVGPQQIQFNIQY